MSAGRLWRNGDFVRLWSAQTVSTFGSLITRPALPFLAILVLNAGPAQIAILRAADHVPGFLIGLFAGVVIDRFRRRPVLIAADIGRALVLGSIPLVALTGHVTIEQLFAVALLASMLSVFFDVGFESYLPAVVPAPRLFEANGKIAASLSVAEVSAFGIAGWLVQIFTAPVAILIDAVTFLFSAGFIGSIRTPESRTQRTAGGTGVFREIREGLGILWRDPTLRALAGAFAALELSFGIVGTVISLYVLRELGFTPGPLGLIFAVGGAASLIAALVAPRLTAAVGVGSTLVGGLLLTGLGILLLPLAHGAGLLAFALLVAQQVIGDGGATVFDINQSSLRQTIAPARVLGRINAATRSAGLGATLVGIAISAVLAQGAGYRAALVAGAIATLAGAAMLFTAPQLRPGSRAAAATPE
ncbi:MAG: MFS transporter [Candidatus Dormibacteraeota bacterium]|nr:MFS transporter [Candidatus Dormibacteraeota bacterium]